MFGYSKNKEKRGAEIASLVKHVVKCKVMKNIPGRQHTRFPEFVFNNAPKDVASIRRLFNVHKKEMISLRKAQH